MKKNKDSQAANPSHKSLNHEDNILHERAIKLAEIVEKETKNINLIDVVQFTLNMENYGIESSRVSRVCEANKIAYLPCVPGFVEGVINVHGRMISVINLKNYFGMENTEATDLSRVIIIGNDECDIGLIVDSLSDIIKVDLQNIQTNVSSITGISAKYFRGITQDQKIILDTDILLNSNLFNVNDNA